MIHNFLIVVLVILPYFLVSGVLLGVSMWVVNRLWVNPIENTSNINQVRDITTEPKHYRNHKVA